MSKLYREVLEISELLPTVPTSKERDKLHKRLKALIGIKGRIRVNGTPESVTQKNIRISREVSEWLCKNLPAPTYEDTEQMTVLEAVEAAENKLDNDVSEIMTSAKELDEQANTGSMIDLESELNGLESDLNELDKKLNSQDMDTLLDELESALPERKPEPIGARIGYRRVSSQGQNLDRQLDDIELDKVFEEKESGAKLDRPELEKLIDYIRQDEYDHVYIHSIDRLSRSIVDMQSIVKRIMDKGASITFVTQAITFKAHTAAAPESKLMFNMLTAFAEFERSISKQRQSEGIAKAKARGVYQGRQIDTNSELYKAVIADVKAGELSKSAIAAKHKISRPRLYRYTDLAGL